MNLFKKVWRLWVGWTQKKNAERAAIADLDDWSVRDQEACDFYRQFIPEGGLCFDVGANVGNRSKVFLRLANKVVAVEPQFSCVRILSRLLKQYPGSFVIEEQALGPEDGFLELHVSPNSMLTTASKEWIEHSQATSRFGGNVWKKTIQVPVGTVQGLISKHGVPDFIKIDVEGFEYEVLKGLKTPLKTLSFEFVPERLDASAECLKLLNQLGAIRCNLGLNECFKLRLDEWLAPDAFLKKVEALNLLSSDFGDVYVKWI